MKSKIFNQLSLILFSSFFICPTLSYAADINIITSQTTTQTFTENNQKMTIGAGGDISTTGSAGISETSNTGAVIVVNSMDVVKVWRQVALALLLFRVQQLYLLQAHLLLV